MPLSDRAKTYLVASAVVVVAAGNVLFGLSRTSPDVPAAVPAAVMPAPAPPLPVQVAPAPIREAPAPVVPEPPPPKCDVAACAAAYHSFRESDCMFQPNVGPRRLCTKGKPPP